MNAGNKAFRLLTLVSALFGMMTALAVSVTVDKVQQRYPWNGKVDIDYEISLAAGEVVSNVENFLEFTAIDNSVSPARNYSARAFIQPLSLAEGRHRVTWDANADGLAIVSPSLVLAARIVTRPARYMVVDLSAGSSATTYPVDYLDGEPVGGFCTDEYRGNKLVLRRIVPGSFIAGSPTSEPKRTSANEVQHPVALANEYYIGIFELTQRQLQLISGEDTLSGNSYQGVYRPVDHKGWNEIIAGSTNGSDNYNWPSNSNIASGTALGRLNSKCRAKGASGVYDVPLTGFTLPTEAQWEYACRAGTDTPFGNGVPCSTEAELKEQMDKMGRHSGNKGDGAGGYTDAHTTVGSYQPNAWGLYDMHGNVSEWCLDHYQANLQALGQLVEPTGPITYRDAQRVTRGGSFNVVPASCRSASRDTGDPSANNQRKAQWGYRIAFVVR